MFEVHGTVDGIEAHCRWEHKLVGDAIVLQKAKNENKKKHGYLGVVPEGTNKNYLGNESATEALLALFVFDKNAVFKSDRDDFYKTQSEWEKQNPGSLIVY